MKKLILCMISLFVLISCATTPLEITENDDNLHMVGGKESLLDAIEYPDLALKKGIEGIVTVLAYVDSSGSVRDCKILEGNDYLNNAAIEAMMKQRFHPYILEGIKRPVRVAIPISFNISKDIDIAEFEKDRILFFAEKYINEPVIPITEHYSKRSPGTKHDFYLEALTWWPKENEPDAGYMIKEGEVNPDAFTVHKELLGRLGEIVPGLTAAYLVSGQKAYAVKALEHVRAWFIDPETKMNPHLNYTQAIPNRTKGRAVGILEGLEFVEIIQSLQYLEKFLSESERTSIENWLKGYKDFLEWGDLSDDLIDRKDNFSTAWLLQLSAVAKYLKDEEYIALNIDYFIQHTIPFSLRDQTIYVNPDLNRKIEYNIFFKTDMLAVVAELLKDQEFDSWGAKYYTGARIGDLINYVYSGILNYDLKTSGQYEGRFLSLLFAGKAYDNLRYLELWRDTQSGEYKAGNFAIRQPILWIK